MARAFRIHASERGFDYRSSSMVAFGGSGSVHAIRVARRARHPPSGVSGCGGGEVRDRAAPRARSPSRSRSPENDSCEKLTTRSSWRPSRRSNRKRRRRLSTRASMLPGSRWSGRLDMHIPRAGTRDRSHSAPRRIRRFAPCRALSRTLRGTLRVRPARRSARHHHVEGGSARSRSRHLRRLLDRSSVFRRPAGADRRAPGLVSRLGCLGERRRLRPQRAPHRLRGGRSGVRRGARVHRRHRSGRSRGGGCERQPRCGTGRGPARGQPPRRGDARPGARRVARDAGASAREEAQGGRQ